MLNINQASAAELELLPGVGKIIAQRIITFRNRHGGFRNIEELKQVKGIGEKRFAQIKPYVRVIP